VRVDNSDEPWLLGIPCWAELVSRDPQAVIPFYEGVFNWEQGPGVGSPAPGDIVFCREDGDGAAGIGRTPEGVELASFWLTYFVTADVDATVTAVQNQGGSVVHPARDRAGFGRSAIVADPTGAVFGVCRLLDPVGLDEPNEPGALITVDLRTSDAPKAREFYAAVLGFSYTDVPAIPGYSSVQVPGSEESFAGIGELRPEEELGDSSHWLVYLALEADTDSAALKARWAGGQVLLGPYDAGGSRNAMLTDPQGALFAVVGDYGYPRLG
jgi:predicted enzyme related to lactoylglutathione lyase